MIESRAPSWEPAPAAMHRFAIAQETAYQAGFGGPVGLKNVSPPALGRRSGGVTVFIDQAAEDLFAPDAVFRVR